RLQQWRRTRIAGSEDDIRRESHQVGCIGAEAIGIARSPSGLDLHIAADGPARLLQTLQKYSIARLSERIVRIRVHEHADAPHALALLRPRHSRPRRRAAEQHDDLASPHVDFPRLAVSACRPASVIFKRTTSTVRPPTIMRSTFAIARPGCTNRPAAR